jgi:hypothetical protein
VERAKSSYVTWSGNHENARPSTDRKKNSAVLDFIFKTFQRFNNIEGMEAIEIMGMNKLIHPVFAVALEIQSLEFSQYNEISGEFQDTIVTIYLMSFSF